MSASDLNNEKMIATNIRFERDSYGVIKGVAEEHNVSMAHLVRISVGRNLEKYLSSVKFLDANQGAEVIRSVNELTNATMSVKNELNRIGVNLNQRIRLMRQRQEIMQNVRGGYDAIRLAHLEQQALDNEIKKYEQDLSVINDVMADYDALLAEIGKALWLLQK